MKKTALALRPKEQAIALPVWREPKGLEEAKGRVGILLRSVHENAYQLGKTLLWVKGQLAHGAFLPWIEKHFGKSERAAQYAMGFAQRCDVAGNLLDVWVSKSARVADFTPPPLPIGKFRVIYADPPWSYSNSGFAQSAEAIYPTMPTEEISTLDIPSLSADDAVLFLWATAPNVTEAFKVMEAWGFSHVENMVWKKNRAPGLGWWLSVIHEWLLIGIRGRPGHPKEKPVSVFESPVLAHSEKPRLVYELIESMFPGVLDESYYIELFARNSRRGWKAWGNEIEAG